MGNNSQVDPVNGIEVLRKNLYHFDNTCLGEKPWTGLIDDVVFTENKKRYDVIVDGVIFSLLYIHKNSDSLIISFRSGFYDIYPSFSRHTYSSFFNTSMLCLDDPMHRGLVNNDIPTWYYGTSDVSYLKLFKKIVLKLCKQLNIGKYRLYFIGSSMAGYAALYMCNIVDYSFGIGISPQLYLNSWSEKASERFLQMGIDLSVQDVHKRNFLTLNNNNSFFFIITNALSRIDYEKHLIPFCKSKNIIPGYGISQHGNIIIWLHHSDGVNKHTSNPERIGLQYIIYLSTYIRKIYKNKFYLFLYNIFKRIKFINITNISMLFSEYNNVIYKEKKKLYEMQNNYKIWNNYIFNIVKILPNDIYFDKNGIMKRYIQFYIKDLNKKIHYELQYSGEFKICFHIEIDINKKYIDDFLFLQSFGYIYIYMTKIKITIFSNYKIKNISTFCCS